MRPHLFPFTFSLLPGCRLISRLVQILSIATILFLIAPAAHAQAVPGLALPITDDPIVITADTVTWLRAEDKLLFTGNVVVEHPQYRVEATRAEASLSTKNIVVSGGVRITGKDGSVLTADSAQLNPDSGQGWMVKARLSIPWQEQRFQFKGEKFERVDENTYVITHGEFTWCNCPDDQAPDWSVSADEMKAGANGDLVARGATINLRNHPFFSAPYLRYPLATGRRSGFLSPTVARSSRNGLEVEEPYYQTLGPSMDATIGPRWLQYRGIDLGGEFRYNLGPEAEGQLWGFGIDDSLEGVSRGGVRVVHHTEIGDRLTLAADAVWISDNEVIYDFDHRNLGNQHARMLESRAYVSLHDPESMNLTVEASVFDDLMGGDVRPNRLGQDRDAIMPQRLPAVTYTLLTRPLAGPLYVDVEGSAVNYWAEETYLRGQFYELTPRVALPARLGGAVDFWAAAGWTEWYAVPNPEFSDARTSGGAAIGELRASAQWEGYYSDPKRKYRNEVRPEFLAYYLGQPPQSQEFLALPLLPDDERALVGMRLDSRLWSRPTDKRRSPDQTARIELTQLYDFHANEWRDLRVEAMLGKPSPFSFDVDAYKSWEDGGLSRLTTRVGYDFGSAQFTVGYIYDSGIVRAPLVDYDFTDDQAVTGSVSYNLNDRQRLTYNNHYSIIFGRMIRESLDYDYQARQRCWGFNISVADRIRPTDPNGQHDVSASVNLRLTPPTPP